MKNSSKIFIGVGVVLAIIIIWFFSTRNGLVAMKENIESQQAQIETTLQRRSDLIPNLVSTVKGYTAHEEKVFKEVSDARSKLAGTLESGNFQEITEANNNLSSALSKLIAISESYPDLKASDQFTALQDELAGTENRITVARQHYNEAVQSYNSSVQRFPTSIVAGMSGYYPMPYFKADEGAEKVPEVNFD